VRGPRNQFGLDPARGYVFVAGGIGITPLLPMIEAAAAAGSTWTLLYGGRTAASMAYAGVLAEHHSPLVQLRPQDQHGLLDLDAILAARSDDALIYCCGPAALLDGVVQRCASLPAGALHVERFTPKDLGDLPPARPPASSTSGSCTPRTASTGHGGASLPRSDTAPSSASTECGLGRREPDAVVPLLCLHREVSSVSDTPNVRSDSREKT
jgi:ferredoxin-NADP reductase